jgi:hypothetical protein
MGRHRGVCTVKFETTPPTVLRFDAGSAAVEDARDLDSQPVLVGIMKKSVSRRHFPWSREARRAR